ncbi:MAG: hypothetical protein ACRCYU_07745 [Nocardioides sp.]
MSPTRAADPFVSWLTAGGEIHADHARTEDALNDRRDEAVIRLMFETAIPLGRARRPSTRRPRLRRTADHDPP